MFTSCIRLLAAASALLAITACASSRNLDASLSDLGANAQLKGVLFTDRSHDYSDIDITLYEGRLLLTGSVHSEDARNKVIANAWKADGVNEVIDEIFVGDQTPFGQGITDARLDQTLRAKFVSDKEIASSRYKITVSSGMIYLLGGASSADELDKAVAIARSLGGVKKVVSYVSLPQPTVAQQDAL